MRNLIISVTTIFVIILGVQSCSDGNIFRGKSQGVGNSCFPDISNCDISGNYNLAGTDVSPLFVYNASMPISQDKQPLSDVVLAPFFYFYTGLNTYIFRSVGAATWDGDSIKATIHGKLRLSATGYPAVGGFAITFKLDAKQKTFTNQYYYSQLTQMTLPALDGTMILSDTAHVIFPVTDTKTKALFTQF